MIRAQRKNHVTLCHRGASLTVIRFISLSPTSRNQLRLAHIGRADIESEMHRSVNIRCPNNILKVQPFLAAALELSVFETGSVRHRATKRFESLNPTGAESKA